jgi:hypothetical protein
VVVSKRGRRSGERREKVRDVFVGRPFEGLATEAEWVAMRELVPAGTAALTLTDHPDRPVVLTTVLPMAFPALVKPDGRILLSVQTPARSGNLSRDLAQIVEVALETEPGNYVSAAGLPGPGRRLQDLFGDAGKLEVTVHSTFDYWLDDPRPDDPEISASLEEANKSILPTVAVTAAPAAYWCQVSEKAHLRWVLPEAEDVALNALARLQAAGDLALGPAGRYVGAFRAHGLLAPVWDLPRDREASEYEEPLAALAKRYADAVAVTDPLTSTERRARDGLRGRQLTLR